jgi:hypothetical protein
VKSPDQFAPPTLEKASKALDVFPRFIPFPPAKIYIPTPYIRSLGGLENTIERRLDIDTFSSAAAAAMNQVGRKGFSVFGVLHPLDLRLQTMDIKNLSGEETLLFMTRP